MHVPCPNNVSYAQGASIEPETLPQCFRCALLCAPQQGYDSGLFGRRGVRNPSLLFRGEIVCDEGCTMGLDQFHIAAHLAIAGRDRADRRPGTMAQRNGHGKQSVRSMSFRRATYVSNDFDFRQGRKRAGQFQAGSKRAFGRPASQPPIGTSSWKTHSPQSSDFPRAQPILSAWNRAFSLFQKIDFHQNSFRVVMQPPRSTSGAGLPPPWPCRARERQSDKAEGWRVE